MRYLPSGSSAWQIYWFEHNLQGDVVAVYDTSGTKLVSYTYDAWGNTATTQHATSIPTPVQNNPFRYRGYYFDIDLNLYYLNARYYDQGTGRFISGDCYVSTGQGLPGYNMFAYCGNSPVFRTDLGGESWGAIFAACVIIVLSISLLVGSEKQEATEEQIQHAIEAAGKSDHVSFNENNLPDGNKECIITIDTKYILDSVDEIAYDEFYKALYDNYLEEAELFGVPNEKLMSERHIRWEFRAHIVAYYLNIPNAKTTDLNVDETFFSMDRRAFK